MKNTKREKINIDIIFGGKSPEHEVSIESAKSIVKALNKKKYKIVLIGITKRGKWIYKKEAKKLLNGQKIEKKQGIGLKLPVLNSNSKIDVFFPILHGPYGEDGRIQGLFEMMNKPYVGAGVEASAIGMDKITQKIIFRAVGLPVSDFLWFNLMEQNCDIIKCLETKIKKRKKRMDYPFFVKPSNSGSSIGISKVHNKKELSKAIKLARQFDKKIIIEKTIKKAREIELSVLGNKNPQVSLPGEVVPSNEFYDYKAKYIDNNSKLIIPAKLTKQLIKKLQKLAITAYQSIGCSGMARVDFLLNSKERIYLNEINTIPGFTSISMYPKLWQVSGLVYSKLLDKLIKLAIDRWRNHFYN